MKRVKLALALHNHQPVGNFPWVFAQAYRDAYEPMLAALERHPHVRLALHYSGPLLDWLRVERPEFIVRLRALVRRGQVEIMGGAYYEPILASIPDRDKLGQILKMSQVLEEDFGVRPRGVWMAERVWEPHLPRSLADAGVAWTILDDTHFKMAGLDDADLDGAYLTEELGHAVAVYASLQELRYLIPWGTVPTVIAYLRDQATEDGERLLVMGDDGEKFGSWPTTYSHCWERGWVERFFQTLAEEQGWLELVLLGEHAATTPPRGRIYLPTASYAEMMEWALPAERSHELRGLHEAFAQEGRADVLRYLRGGFWRNFLAKYPEVNALHKKMLRVHDKVWEATRRAPDDDVGLDELWQGQCNCPYWHGVFGGIYMAAIRAEMYRRLILAERKAERALHGPGPRLAIEVTDYDCDGWPEVLIEGSAAKLIVAPRRGGALVEWDLVPSAWNLLATMARRPEAYHLALRESVAARHADGGVTDEEVRSIHGEVRVKDERVLELLTYDRHGRHGAVEHVLGPEVDFEAFRRGTYADAADFAAALWRANPLLDDRGAHVHLARAGLVRLAGANGAAQEWPVALEKTLTLSAAQDELRVHYRLRNEGTAPLHARFASEWNANLVGGSNPAAYVLLPGQQEDRREPFDADAEHAAIERFALGNDHLGVHLQLSLSAPATLWRFSVESVSSSEGGIERVHQGSCFAFVWDLALAPGEEWARVLRWSWT